jgi:hypothetical protein
MINDFNSYGSRKLTVPPVPPDLPKLYLDVSGNNVFEPLDILLAISDLNARGPRVVPPLAVTAPSGQPESLVADGEGEFVQSDRLSLSMQNVAGGIGRDWIPVFLDSAVDLPVEGEYEPATAAVDRSADEGELRPAVSTGPPRGDEKWPVVRATIRTGSHRDLWEDALLNDGELETIIEEIAVPVDAIWHT